MRLLLVSQRNQKRGGTMFEGGGRDPSSVPKKSIQFIIKTNHCINPSFKKLSFLFLKIERDLVPCAPHH